MENKDGDAAGGGAEGNLTNNSNSTHAPGIPSSEPEKASAPAPNPDDQSQQQEDAANGGTFVKAGKAIVGLVHNVASSLGLVEPPAPEKKRKQRNTKLEEFKQVADKLSSRIYEDPKLKPEAAWFFEKVRNVDISDEEQEYSVLFKQLNEFLRHLVEVELNDQRTREGLLEIQKQLNSAKFDRNWRAGTMNPPYDFDTKIVDNARESAIRAMKAQASSDLENFNKLRSILYENVESELRIEHNKRIAELDQKTMEFKTRLQTVRNKRSAVNLYVRVDDQDVASILNEIKSGVQSLCNSVSLWTEDTCVEKPFIILHCVEVSEHFQVPKRFFDLQQLTEQQGGEYLVLMLFKSENTLYNSNLGPKMPSIIRGVHADLRLVATSKVSLAMGNSVYQFIDFKGTLRRGTNDTTNLCFLLENAFLDEKLEQLRLLC